MLDGQSLFEGASFRKPSSRKDGEIIQVRIVPGGVLRAARPQNMRNVKEESLRQVTGLRRTSSNNLNQPVLIYGRR